MPNVLQGTCKWSQNSHHDVVLYVTNNCWTRSFTLGYWLFHFSSDLTQMRGKTCIRKYILLSEYACCLFTLAHIGNSQFYDHRFLYYLKPTCCWINHGEAYEVDTCIVLPLRVYCLMRSTHNALQGVIMTSSDSPWLYFWLCLLFLERSARFDVSPDVSVHTFPVYHGSHCHFET